MNKWLIVALIVVAFALDGSVGQDCDMEGDEEDDECCTFHKVQEQVLSQPMKTPEILKLPNVGLTTDDLPKVVQFVGAYLTIPGVLQPNQGLKGPLGNVSDALLLVMQQNCDVVIYAFQIGLDNALWHTGKQGQYTNCTLHVNKDWTMDMRSSAGLKIWTSGLHKAYLEKATRLHVIPTKDESDLQIRMVLLNQDNSKNIVIGGS